MKNLHTPDQFKTRKARIAMGIIGLILMYLMASRAFDTGSLWQYLVTIILLVISIRFVFTKA